jgi:Flp pilus assembly protein TadG
MVAAQVALCMGSLCGVAAFAIDCGMMYEYRRRAQAATDAAALAAAEDLYSHYISGRGIDPDGTAVASAKTTASANGFTSDGSTSTVTVNIPPKSGNFVNQAGFAEVIITYYQTRAFSGVFGTGNIPITARSVARGLWTSYANGIILLNPTGSGALTDTGGGSVVVTGASIIIDSSSSSAAVDKGGGTATASQFLITGSPGDLVVGNGQFIGGIESGVIPTLDPLAYLPEPDVSSLSQQSNSTLKFQNSDTVTLNPGVYNGGIAASANANLTLNPGIYYMNGGGFSITGGAGITANGVMIYNAPNNKNDVVTISGTGLVNMTGPTSGIYQGISVFQDRTSSAPLSLSGSGNMNINGTVYGAQAILNLIGNGAQNVVGSQYIVYDMTASGNGNATIKWTSDTSSRTRRIGLVE